MSDRAMGSHHSHNAGTTTWLTPPHIIEALGPFDFDPCAVVGWSTADRHHYLEQHGDGLAADWRGRVWLNPPYGNEVWAWLAKLADHGSGTALIFARTETAGFVREVWGKADAVMFLHGRLHFHHADGTRAPANAGAPSCLVAYGPGDVAALRHSALDGTFVPDWKQPVTSTARPRSLRRAAAKASDLDAVGPAQPRDEDFIRRIKEIDKLSRERAKGLPDGI